MRVDSPYWDRKTGVCEKHLLPLVPCPSCMEEQDKDVEVRLDEMDRLALDFDVTLTVRDLLPAKYGDWLMERIVS